MYTCMVTHPLHIGNLMLLLTRIQLLVKSQIRAVQPCQVRIWTFINVGPMLVMENFSKSPVRPYTSCTGQLWNVHRFPSGKVCFGLNSRAVQHWQVSELEFKFINCGPILLLAMENFSKSPVGPYPSCTGQVWYVHWLPFGKMCFDQNSRAVQPWQVSEV